MFGSKPRPPHCEDLTNAQMRWVNKITQARYAYKAVEYAETMVSRGWLEVFPAVAAQERFAWGEDRKYQFLSRMIEKAPIAVSVGAMAKVGRMRINYAGALLAQLLVKMEEGEQQAGRVLIAGQQDANLMGAMIVALCEHDDMPPQRRDFIRALITQGADVHYDTGNLLKTALRRGYVGVAEDLTAAGFDYGIYGETLRSYLVDKQAPHAALVFIDKMTGRSSAAPALAGVAGDTDGYVRAGDCISRCDQLAGGGNLTTVFNFATRQQIVIAHIAGQTAAPVVTSFSQIEGDAGLLLAAEAFVRQGGEAALAQDAVFSPVRAGAALRIEKPAAQLQKPAS